MLRTVIKIRYLPQYLSLFDVDVECLTLVPIFKGSKAIHNISIFLEVLIELNHQTYCLRCLAAEFLFKNCTRLKKLIICRKINTAINFQVKKLNTDTQKRENNLSPITKKCDLGNNRNWKLILRKGKKL